MGFQRPLYDPPAFLLTAVVKHDDSVIPLNTPDGEEFADGSKLKCAAKPDRPDNALLLPSEAFAAIFPTQMRQAQKDQRMTSNVYTTMHALVRETP